VKDDKILWDDIERLVRQLIRQAVVEEREACAKIAAAHEVGMEAAYDYGAQIAAAIRART
jgi:hypothetical protein